MTKKNDNRSFLTIAEAIAEKVTVKEGVIVEGRTLYDANLPKGIKPETADKVNQYNADFLAATAKVVGELGHAGEDSEVSASFATGHGQFEHLFQKEVTIAGEKRQNYMTSTVMMDLGDDTCAIAKVHADIAVLVSE